MNKITDLAKYLNLFFVEYLPLERGVSIQFEATVTHFLCGMSFFSVKRKSRRIKLC